MSELQGELWTVWVEYEQPECGCNTCTRHERRRRVTTYSARAVDEAGAMARGVEIAQGKGDLYPRATMARRMGGGT
jgi:hypothetical protein